MSSSLSSEILSHAGGMQDTFNFMRDVVMGYPMIAVFAGFVAFGLVKKLIKLAVFAGILACVWLAIQFN